MTDVFYLLRFFLTMPSRDTDHTPASSRTEASMAALVRSAAHFSTRFVMGHMSFVLVC